MTPELRARWPTLTAEPLKPLVKHETNEIVLGRDPQRNPVYFPLRARLEHCLIVGSTGAGKSRLILHIIRQAINRGEGLLFLDPHGNHPDSDYKSVIATISKTYSLVLSITAKMISDIAAMLPGTLVENEVVSGSGTSWTLANTPISGSVKLFGGGTRLTPGAGNDYTISGTSITTVNSYPAGTLIADYRR